MANDWKKRMVKPSKRTLIYSKKLNQWLNESEEDIAMLEMIYDKRQAVMKKLQETDLNVRTANVAVESIISLLRLSPLLTSVISNLGLLGSTYCPSSLW